MKIAMGVLAFLALFAGLIQVPGVDDVVTNFLEPVFADSPLAAIEPSVGAAWVGLAIGGGDLASPGSASPTGSTSLRPETPAALIRRLRPAPHLPRQQVVLRRADRRPHRPPGAGDRPLRQPRLRALRRRRPRHRHRGDGARRRRRRPRRPERLRPQLRAAAGRRLRRARPLLPARAAHDQLAALDPAGLRHRRPLPAEAGGRLVGDARRGRDAGDRDRHGRSASTPAAPACSTRVDIAWISGLGVDYSLGIDGLNLFLILLTAVLWIGGIAFAAFREQERPQLFFFLMLIAETATLGSFLAQDLLLFVLFFDFMLVPFYFLFGAWGSDREGGPTAAAATLKMIDLHPDRLAADAGRGDRGGDHLRRRRPPHLLDRGDPATGPRRRQPALDLLVLRRRLPGQDAGLPPARLDARRLPGGAAAGAGRSSPGCWRRSAPTASCASCCRSSPTPRSSSRRWSWSSPWPRSSTAR